MVEIHFGEKIADLILYNLLNLNQEAQLTKILHFFIHDILEITILLVIISFIVGLIKSYLTPNVVEKYLRSVGPASVNLCAAALGVLTPCCSCCVCPLFMGLIQAGVPLGATLTYLIAAPLANEVTVVLIWGLFGTKIALIYLFCSVLIALICGSIMGSMKLEKYIIKESKHEGDHCNCHCKHQKNFKTRLEEAKENMIENIGSTWFYIIIGVGLGSLIQGALPTDLLIKYAGSQNLFAVPVSTLIGIPLYANIIAILPVLEALVKDGMALGTVLSFAMAITAVSLPEILILKRILKAKLLLIFTGFITISIIITGYILNIFLK